MKKQLLISSIIALTVLASCSGGKNNKELDFLIDSADIKETIDRETYSNSFSDEQIKEQWSNYGIGDPFVYRFNGMYYLYVSTANNKVGVRAYKSKDLVTWTPCQGEGLPLGYVSDDECTKTAYAPEVMYWNGKFYMTQSMGGTGHYLLTSDSPEGPFVDTGASYADSIDGSFFIDDDEKLYLLYAGKTGIKMQALNNDVSLATKKVTLEAAQIGDWTEGPYCLKKDGNYFVTFTGTSVTRPGYHIAYAYHSKLNNNDFFSREGFTFGDNTILSTDDKFNGLGHSSTVLGPNLDSYYIAYHSLESAAGPKRRFCVNRLLFNETEMQASYYGLNDNIKPQMPEFSVDNGQSLNSEGDFHLSNKTTDNLFTAEFNFVGANTKCIFSFVDSNNYAYAQTTSNTLKVVKVSNGTESTIDSYTFKNSYDLTKLHSIRVAYSESLLDVYFDTMHFVNKNVELSSGKIGYQYIDKANIYSTSFSNAAHDSSQKEDYHKNIILVNDYVKKYSTLNDSDFVTNSSTGNNGLEGGRYLKFHDNKTVTYKLYIPEDGYYAVDATLAQESQGKRVQLRVDNEQYVSFNASSITKNDQDYKCNVGGAAFKKGTHYLTVAAEDSTLIRSFNIYRSSTKVENFSNSLSDFVTKGVTYVTSWKVKNGGHYSLSGNRQLVYFGDSGIRDVEAEIKVNFDGETAANTVGLIIRGSNAEFASKSEADNIQGYYVGINNSKVFIRECNYNLSSTGSTDAISLSSGVDHTLKAVMNGNVIEAFVNGNKVLSYQTKSGPTHGYVGLYTNGAAATFKDINIKVNK